MEKKNRGLIIAVIFLAICVLGLSGYLIYDKVLNKENTKGNSTVETNKNDTEKENVDNNKDNNIKEPEKARETIETDPKLSEIGEELFKIVNTTNYCGTTYPLIGKKNIVFEDLTDYDKYEIIYRLIDSNSIKINNNIDADQCLSIDANLSNEDIAIESRIKQQVEAGCVAASISKNVFENKYHEIYGNNKKMENLSFLPVQEPEFPAWVTCYLYEDDIVCLIQNGGDDPYGTQEFINYQGIKEVDGNLVMTVDYLFVKFDADSYTKEDEGIYSIHYDTNYKIDDLTYYKSLSKSNDKSLKEKLFQKYANNCGRYEITFKKDSNDNWYWYSTQMVS